MERRTAYEYYRTPTTAGYRHFRIRTGGTENARCDGVPTAGATRHGASTKARYSVRARHSNVSKCVENPGHARRSERQSMLNPYRRHLKTCPERAKKKKNGKWDATKGKASYAQCSCPIWCDGELTGKRYKHSLNTRDWGRAGLRLAKLEAPGARQPKPISEAIEAFNGGQADERR